MFNINNKNILTNFYTKYNSGSSHIFIQVYGQPRVEFNKISEEDYTIILHDTILNFSDDIKYINDGLVDYISFSQNENDVIFKIHNIFETSHQIDEMKDIPYTFHLSFDRQITEDRLNGIKIAVGYSKRELISKTGLKEKDIMKKLSSEIIKKLVEAGCNIAENDADINLYITETDENEDYSGYSLSYTSDDLINFVDLLHKNFRSKLPLDDHGVKKSERDKSNTVIIEAANINSRLDDAHLRSKDYREKIFESILVSLIEYCK